MNISESWCFSFIDELFWRFKSVFISWFIGKCLIYGVMDDYYMHARLLAASPSDKLSEEKMSGVDRVKELLHDPTLSDKEIEEIRDGFYNLSELIFEQWVEEHKKVKASEKEKVQGEDKR